MQGETEPEVVTQITSFSVRWPVILTGETNNRDQAGPYISNPILTYACHLNLNSLVTLFTCKALEITLSGTAIVVR